MNFNRIKIYNLKSAKNIHTQFKFVSKLIGLFLLVFSLDVYAQEQQNKIGNQISEALNNGLLAAELQSKMVWSGLDAGKPAYTVFRKTFNLADFDAATIRIFADTKYILWINGKEVLRGPCRFDPVAPSFDSKEVNSFLVRGKNAVVVMVMSHGSNGKMMDHLPGLTVNLSIKKQSQTVESIWTDTSWKWNDHTRFLPPAQTWGFVCDRIDARLDDGEWSHTGYDDSRWAAAVPIDGSKWGNLSPRTIPLLAEKKMGWSPLNKRRLPVELQTGQSYTLRADEMIQGFPVVRFSAKEGVLIKFGMGYTGDSTKVSNSYDAACFYTTKSGDQEFVPADSYGFKFLNISILSGGTWAPYQVRINEIELVDRRYPYLETGSFKCDDPFLTELWKRSALTMKVNCEDGYMDCALREKTEWMGDGAVVQYPLSRTIFAIADSAGIPRSDNGLIISMLRHIAQSQSDVGLLKAHHPSNRFDIHAYIEDYSCLWVQALRAVYEHSGNIGLVRELWKPLKKQMNWFENHITANGLVLGREFTFTDNPLVYCFCEGATLNAFVYKAFLDAAFLAKATRDAEAEKKYKQMAQNLFDNYNKYLWMPSKQTYSSGLYKGEQMMPTVHAALLALNRGLVPENRQQQLKDYLFANYRNQGKNYSRDGVIPKEYFNPDQPSRGVDMPYTSFWMLEELFNDGRDTEALSFIHEKWERMMKDSITGTLWEAFGGGDLCHNMGAVSAYFLSTRVLGVTEKLPITSGVIEIKPMLGKLNHAEGTVVTVHGPVQVKWEKQEGELSFSISIPVGTTAQVSLPVGKTYRELLIGDKKSSFRIKKNRMVFQTKSDISGKVLSRM